MAYLLTFPKTSNSLEVGISDGVTAGKIITSTPSDKDLNLVYSTGGRITKIPDPPENPVDVTMSTPPVVKNSNTGEDIPISEDEEGNYNFTVEDETESQIDVELPLVNGKVIRISYVNKPVKMNVAVGDVVVHAYNYNACVKINSQTGEVISEVGTTMFLFTAAYIPGKCICQDLVTGNVYDYTNGELKLIIPGEEDCILSVDKENNLWSAVETVERGKYQISKYVNFEKTFTKKIEVENFHGSIEINNDCFYHAIPDYQWSENRVDLLIRKYNFQSKLEWEKRVTLIQTPENKNSLGSSVNILNDKHGNIFVFAEGHYQLTVGGEKTQLTHIYKFSSAGDLLWEVNPFFQPYSPIVTSGSNILFFTKEYEESEETFPPISASHVMILDKDGVGLWSLTLQGEEINNINIGQDNFIYIASSGGLRKVNASGQIVWHQTQGLEG